MILAVLTAPVCSYVLWTCIALEVNYRRAKSMGIPLIRIPVDFLNIPWQVVEHQIWAITDFLRLPLPRCARYMRRGWHFADKSKTHQELGPLYALVTPRDIYVGICDAEVVNQVLSRRQDFPRPAKNYELLAVYGQSLSTAKPEDWARHRKVFATPFMNETIMKSVWDESIRQTRQMIRTWTSIGIGSVAGDTRTLSLNVLAAIGFRKSFDFRPRTQEAVLDNGKFSYRDALQLVLDNIIVLLIVPRKYLSYSWLPGWVRKIGKAADDFQLHMEGMLDDELVALNRGENRNSLMTSLVRALDTHQKDSRQGISVEEIFGNLFIVNFAGHDTTANTLAFSTLLLSAFPDVQNWVAEEVDAVMRKTGDAGPSDYSALFPQLLRCKAIMLETLRLFPPIMSLPKTTNRFAQTIYLGEQQITIPPNVTVMNNILAIHTNPMYWPEPLSWKPSRWMVQDDAGNDVLFVPPRDTYFSWSDGPQNCPGLKFSQVEFVAVLSCLLQEHRIHPVAETGETREQLQARVLGVVNDCEQPMLLKMKDSDRIDVRCEKHSC